jgi:hypothetical protein
VRYSIDLSAVDIAGLISARVDDLLCGDGESPTGTIDRDKVGLELATLCDLLVATSATIGGAAVVHGESDLLEPSFDDS